MNSHYWTPALHIPISTMMLVHLVLLMELLPGIGRNIEGTNKCVYTCEQISRDKRSKREPLAVRPKFAEFRPWLLSSGAANCTRCRPGSYGNSTGAHAMGASHTPASVLCVHALIPAHASESDAWFAIDMEWRVRYTWLCGRPLLLHSLLGRNVHRLARLVHIASHFLMWDAIRLRPSWKMTYPQALPSVQHALQGTTVYPVMRRLKSKESIHPQHRAEAHVP